MVEDVKFLMLIEPEYFPVMLLYFILTLIWLQAELQNKIPILNLLNQIKFIFLL